MTIPDKTAPVGVHPLERAAMVTISVAMVGLSWFHIWPLGLTEVLGFASGGVCVWLLVREHWATWPIGLATNVCFFLLFLTARLYADMSLQVIYFTLGAYGWWNWLYGGTAHQTLLIAKTRLGEWLGLALGIPLCTLAMTAVLFKVNDAAPFWDSSTTGLSLAGQFLMCRKRLENWYFWIAVDVIYIPLYLTRSLPLIAVLYGVFFAMSVIGLSQWKKKLKGIQAGTNSGTLQPREIAEHAVVSMNSPVL